MSTWEQITTAAPEFAERARALFNAHKHKTLATLRKDGSPRISGIEAEFSGGEVTIGSMPDSMKGRDLLRDPRLALHSGSEDPDESDPSAWPGDAKLSGRAIEIGNPNADGPAGTYFKIDVGAVVLTYVDAGNLVIESWHQDLGYQRRQRT